jgi:membrane associated rhomboid family serine protease
MCPYCGTSRPGTWWKNNAWTRALGQTDLPVRIIIYTNLALYVISLLFNRWAPGMSVNPLVFFTPNNHSLLLLGATGTIPIDQYHRWWTLVSAGYLHGGLLHIFFNIMAFRQLSELVVGAFGIYRLIIIYAVSGAAGFWVSYIAGVPFTIGASASICGLIGAVLYYGKSRGGAYGQAIYKQIGIWAIAIFAFGFMISGINNWGHGGGIASGALMGFLLKYEEKHRETLAHKLLAAACVVITVGVLCWALFTGVYFRFF